MSSICRVVDIDRERLKAVSGEMAALLLQIYEGEGVAIASIGSVLERGGIVLAEDTQPDLGVKPEKSAWALVLRAVLVLSGAIAVGLVIGRLLVAVAR